MLLGLGSLCAQTRIIAVGLEPYLMHKIYSIQNYLTNKPKAMQASVLSSLCV